MAQKVEDIEADLKSFRAKVTQGLRRLERGLERLAGRRPNLPETESPYIRPFPDTHTPELSEDSTCDSVLESWDGLFGFFQSFSADVDLQFETFEERINAIKSQQTRLGTTSAISSATQSTHGSPVSATRVLLTHTDPYQSEHDSASSSDPIPRPADESHDTARMSNSSCRSPTPLSDMSDSAIELLEQEFDTQPAEADVTYAAEAPKI